MNGHTQLELELGISPNPGWGPPQEFQARRSAAKTSPARLRHLLMVSDLVAILVSLCLALVLQWWIKPVPADVVVQHAALGAFTVPILLVTMGAARLFTARVSIRAAEEARRLGASVAVAVVSAIALAFVVQFGALSRLWVGLLYVCLLGCLLISRAIARGVFRRLRESGRICRRVLIVGTGIDAIDLLHTTQRRPDLGYEVVGFAGDEDIGERGGVRVLGSVDDSADIVRRTGATGAILSVQSLDPCVVNRLTRELTKSHCHVALSSSLSDIDITRARSQDFDGRLMIYVEPNSHGAVGRCLKRAFDVVFASAVLLISLPVLLIAALTIAIESRGSIIFRQLRVGRHGELFPIFKLRTMVPDAEALRVALESQNEADGPLFKIRDDPRVTRVGRFLRKSSIDELPQLWNVLRGEMSIVGPRPALPEESEHWSPALQGRTAVLPGITGMWQVSGRSDSNFEQYERWDLYYVDNWSLLHDMKIVVRTVGVVLLSRGAR